VTRTGDSKRPRADASRASALDGLGALAPLLACPSCKREGGGLAQRAEHFFCLNCKTEFPLVRSGRTRIPWLDRAPEGARLEWRARFNEFLHANSVERMRLERALGEVRRSKPAVARISALLAAREAQRKEIVDLLVPLSLGAVRAAPSLDRAGVLHDRLPQRDSLVGEYDFLLRDWAWESVENDSRVECVREVLPERKAFKAGKLLTLGAGACRLAYDLHLRYAPELSVALDVNPLPLLLAARVLNRETITLHEFPVAPLSQSLAAIPRLCAAPAPLADDGTPFVLVLADALHAPFKPGSFDTVLTPWLLDVVPQSFTDWARTVNRLLAKGGTWINTGPLAFRHPNEAWCFSEEEVLELVAANGFVIGASERKKVPCLQSPASGRGLIERALTFSATKIADSAASERVERYPDWLVDITRAVPDLDELVVASTQHLLQAQILAAIDGKRSIVEIAQFVAKRYGLQKSEAEGAVRRLLREIYDSTVAAKESSTTALQ
jgi:N2227-like protein